MMFFERTFGLLLLFFSLIYPVQAAHLDSTAFTQEEQAWLESHGDEIILAPEENYPPFIFVEDGEVQGLSYDFVNALEEKLGIRFQLAEPTNLSEILEAVRAGEVDIVTSLKSTPERKEILSFTHPYVEVPAVIITRQDHSSELSLGDLSGVRVAVGDGYGVQGFIETVYPDIDLLLVSDDLEGLSDLSFGLVDAVVMDIASASYFIKQEGFTNLKIAGETGYAYDLSFAITNNEPLLASIVEKALSTISDEEQQEILDAWITIETLSFFEQKEFSLLVGVGGSVVALLILLSAVLNWNLKKRISQKEQRVKEEKARKREIQQQLDKTQKALSEKEQSYVQELEQQVDERTKELNTKLRELEQLNKLMVGREMKMVEMKKELKKYKKES